MSHFRKKIASELITEYWWNSKWKFEFTLKIQTTASSRTAFSLIFSICEMNIASFQGMEIVGSSVVWLGINAT
jgi:hypothetical protein